jgi:hypothetical protein
VKIPRPPSCRALSSFKLRSASGSLGFLTIERHKNGHNQRKFVGQKLHQKMTKPHPPKKKSAIFHLCKSDPFLFSACPCPVPRLSGPRRGRLPPGGHRTRRPWGTAGSTTSWRPGVWRATGTLGTRGPSSPSPLTLTPPPSAPSMCRGQAYALVFTRRTVM